MMQKLRNYYALAATATMLAPAIASAQTFENTVQRIKNLLNNTVIPFLVLIATVIFLWGVVRYITAGGDEDKVKEGRNLIIYGIIFLAVMIGVWGFVNIVLTFIFTNNTPANIPGNTGTPRQP